MMRWWGVGTPGRLSLDFDRQANDAVEAISSAIQDVRRAIPGAGLVEVAPDLVGLTDVAGIIGCSRQNLRKYFVGEIERKHRFPAPAYSGKILLWHLDEVATWLRSNSDFDIPDRLVNVARCARALNTFRAGARIDVALQRLKSVAVDAAA